MLGEALKEIFEPWTFRYGHGKISLILTLFGKIDCCIDIDRMFLRKL